MQCPRADGELIAHTTHGEHNLTVSYSTCPVCRGFWMESFSANFIKLPHDTGPRRNNRLYRTGVELHCPVCSNELRRATGDNIPDSVYLYRCPDGHGYFFPAGQLAAFKKAQKTKIEYHKIWHLPIPSVASVLLSVFIALVLAGGLMITFEAVQLRQSTVSQARQILSAHHVYVIPAARGALITAQTEQNAVVWVRIPKFHDTNSQMTSTDEKSHTLTIKKMDPGTYSYYFVIITGGRKLETERYTFVIPK